MATPVPETMSSRTIFMESSRISWYNRGLFLSLSFFFLIPLSVYLSIPSAATVTFYHLRLFVFTITITLLLLICGIATITYLTYHAFSGRVVTLFSAFISLRYSFLPMILITIIAVIFATLSTSIFMFALKLIGLGNKFTSFVIIAFLGLLILPLQVHCALVVAIHESNWSFHKLWLSTKEILSSWRLKSVPMISVMSYFLPPLFIMFVWIEPARDYSGWRLIMRAVFNTALNAFFVSYYTSLITILYLYLYSFDLRSQAEENLFGISDV